VLASIWLSELSGEVTLAEVFDDPLITSDSGLVSEKLFFMEGCAERVSANDLSLALATQHPVVSIPTYWALYKYYSFGFDALKFSLFVSWLGSLRDSRSVER
jgi:hypothetical protein